MNKSVIVLIGLIVIGICVSVCVNHYLNESIVEITPQDYSNNFRGLTINEICESENKTTWWKNKENFYCIGNKPIIENNCSLGGYSICFSKEYIIVMMEITDDVLSETGVKDE